MKKSYKRSSKLLLEIAQDKNLDGDLTYQEVVYALGERAFGIAILFFSLPAILPLAIIPGIALIFSLFIALFAGQMIVKRESLWLPKTIAHKTLSHKKIAHIISTALPYLIKLEYFAKPRWTVMTGRTMEIINGITIIFLSILLIMPIPFSNFIFGAIIILFAFGITEKDGIFISMGYACLSLYMFFLYIITVTALKLY